MNKTLVFVAALFVTCVACSPQNPSVEDGSGTAGAQDDNGIINDGNTVFTIPPTPNANSVGATHTPPTVQTLNATDVSFVQEPTQAGIAGCHAQIIFNSTPNACVDVNANHYHVGEVQIAVTLTDLNDNVAAANTYTYPAATSSQFQILSATYAVVDSTCYYNAVSLQSGQVVLTTSNNGAMAGTYSFTFASETIRGAFNSNESCAALAQPPVDTSSCN